MNTIDLNKIIYEMKSSGMTDRAVGDAVGLSGGAVNRRYQKVMDKIRDERFLHCVLGEKNAF